LRFAHRAPALIQAKIPRKCTHHVIARAAFIPSPSKKSSCRFIEFVAISSSRLSQIDQKIRRGGEIEACELFSDEVKPLYRTPVVVLIVTDDQFSDIPLIWAGSHPSCFMV
jgi:hypothetical protein